MTAKTKFLVGGLGAAVLAWLAFSRDKSPDSTPPATLHGSRAASRSTVESLGTRLSGARLSALERRVQEIEHERPVPGEGTEATGQAGRDQPPDEGVPEPPADPALLERKVTYLEEALRSEPWDPGWSGSTEAQIERALKEAAFDGSSVERTQCGSTFCALVVRHEDNAARLAFERFATALPGMGGSFIFRHAADGKSETRAFFIRPGKDGPDHPVRRF